MRISAILGVKDEIELVAACVAHLRAIGVDLIIAIDSGSTDGSLEWLRQHESSSGLWLVEHDDQNPESEALWYRLAEDLARSAQTDWVIFLDADEFWMPASGSLRATAGLDGLDVLQVARFNVPLDGYGLLTDTRGPPCGLCEVELIVEAIPDFRGYLERFPNTPWIRGVPMPKIMVRPECIGELDAGTHDVHGADGMPLRRSRPVDLLIAHLPFTTEQRMRRKVANIQRFFAAHAELLRAQPQFGWHWQRWLALTDEDAIRREFERQVFDAATLAEHRLSGVVRRSSAVFSEWSQRAELVDEGGA